MVYKSDKFKTGRETEDNEPSSYKRTLSFTKFIKHADKTIDNNPKYDIVSDFEYYDIHCDRCLKQNSKISKLYIMQTDELMRRLARGELIEADSSSILVTCPNCHDIQRITDLRNRTGASIPEHLLPELQSQTGNILSKDRNRDKPITYNLPEESKYQYETLLNMSKANPKVKKELELYIKDYNYKLSQYKDKSFRRDIDAIDTAGLSIIKVEDIEY